MATNPTEKKKAVAKKSAEEAPKKTPAKKKKAEGALEAKAGETKKACKIAKCNRGYRAKGYCKAHYRMWRHGAYGSKRYKICGDLNCQKAMVMNRHGYCEEHYQNYFIKGQAVAKAPVAAAPAPKAEAPKEKAAAS